MSALVTRIEVHPFTLEQKKSPMGLTSRFEAYHLQSKTKIPKDVLAEVFVDRITHQLVLDAGQDNVFKKSPSFCVEVSFKPGVTDNTGASAAYGLKSRGFEVEVSSRVVHLFYQDLSLADLKSFSESFLSNPLIQNIKIARASEFFAPERFERADYPQVNLGLTEELVTPFDLAISFAELKKINEERCLAFSDDELHFLQKTFNSEEFKKQRRLQKMPEVLTDVEIEVIAQSWSEHCKHKIFAAEIDYQETPNLPRAIGAKSISGLYPSYIKAATKSCNKDWLISVFSDNAGIVRFDSTLDLCIKVETHNSPSALDPYGGALTGILGVNRDILGTGLGAKPIANMDVFCFAPPSWPDQSVPEMNDFMPKGLMNPRRILEGVHKGVEDGGNKSGIPTVNGAIHFDPDFCGKPLVFVGTVGILPQRLPDGRTSDQKGTKVGDKIVVIGGAVGADGIHGATFSSLELNESSPSTAVQIGDPLTQKRVMDLLLEARDLGLYSGITDNGAGGLSSSLGEMATLTNGARFDLSLCPTKYPGLKPFEIMISESQERMSLSVAPDKVEAFVKLCEARNVASTVLGEFTDTGFLEVFYQTQQVAALDLNFLHKGLPKMKLKARWEGPRARSTWMPMPAKKSLFATPIKDVLLNLLATPNIASKEGLVRQYDHEVQGATRIRPFTGPEGAGPSDAGAIWLGRHGGDINGVIFVSNGLAPRMSLEDPYLMAKWAVDEAVRNCVASGAHLETLCLLDNFCWPDPVASAKNPDGERKLAELVRTCEGLYDLCTLYQTPLVSGKDSMKNDFRGKNRRGDPLQISILPTLLVTAMGRGELSTVTSTEFKSAGDQVFVIGAPSTGLKLSEVSELFELNAEFNFVPNFDGEKNRDLYLALNRLQQAGVIASAHDLSDGGLLVAAAESLMGSDNSFGLELKISQTGSNLYDALLSEGPGRFLVSVSKSNIEEFKNGLQGLTIEQIGSVTTSGALVLNQEFSATRYELLQAFTQEFGR